MQARTPSSAEALRQRVIRDHAPAIVTPDPGEVIWCDEAGVTCRRWNWRQGLRTRLTAESRRLWFILEALGSMPDTALAAAGAALAHGLMRIWPSSIIVRHNLDPRD